METYDNTLEDSHLHRIQNLPRFFTLFRCRSVFFTGSNKPSERDVEQRVTDWYSHPGSPSWMLRAYPNPFPVDTCAFGKGTILWKYRKGPWKLWTPVPRLKTPSSELKTSKPRHFAAASRLVDASPELFDTTSGLFASTPELLDTTPRLFASALESFDSTPELSDTSPEPFDSTPELFH